MTENNHGNTQEQDENELRKVRRDKLKELLLEFLDQAITF